MKKELIIKNMWVLGLSVMLFAACGTTDNNSATEFNSDIDSIQTEMDTTQMREDSIMTDTTLGVGGVN